MANTKSEYIRRTGSRGKSYRRKPAPSIDNGRRSGRKVESKNPSPLPLDRLRRKDGRSLERLDDRPCERSLPREGRVHFSSKTASGGCWK